MTMKLEKKHIAVLVIAAVAIFLLWRKFGKSATSSASSLKQGNSIDLDYVLSHVTFDSQERSKINEVDLACQKNKEWRDDIQAKAIERGVSYAQELAINAIWMLYDANKIDYIRYSTMVKKIISL